MATKKGIVKKTEISAFKNMRASGIIAIRLEPNDTLVGVDKTTGEDNILLITKKGMSIRFSEKDLRAMGRPTSGVRGIRIADDDEVIGMDVFNPKSPEIKDKRRKVFRDILTVSEKGIGKRTPIDLFPLQKRAGKGVKAAVITPKTGNLAAMTTVTEKIDQVVITSSMGQIIKLPLKNIPQMGRATQGVILMRFAKSDDSVAGVATLEKNITEDEKEEETN